MSITAVPSEAIDQTSAIRFHTQRVTRWNAAKGACSLLKYASLTALVLSVIYLGTDASGIACMGGAMLAHRLFCVIQCQIENKISSHEEQIAAIEKTYYSEPKKIPTYQKSYNYIQLLVNYFHLRKNSLFNIGEDYKGLEKYQTIASAQNRGKLSDLPKYATPHYAPQISQISLSRFNKSLNPNIDLSPYGDGVCLGASLLAAREHIYTRKIQQTASLFVDGAPHEAVVLQSEAHHLPTEGQGSRLHCGAISLMAAQSKPLQGAQSSTFSTTKCLINQLANFDNVAIIGLPIFCSPTSYRNYAIKNTVIAVGILALGILGLIYGAHLQNSFISTDLINRVSILSVLGGSCLMLMMTHCFIRKKLSKLSEETERFIGYHAVTLIKEKDRTYIFDINGNTYTDLLKRNGQRDTRGLFSSFFAYYGLEEGYNSTEFKIYTQGFEMPGTDPLPYSVS